MGETALLYAEKSVLRKLLCLVYKKVSRKFPDLIEAIVYEVYKIARGRGGGGNQIK